MKIEEVIKVLEDNKNIKNIEGMARFGINPEKAYGIRMPVLRKIAKDIGKDHELALSLWDYDHHESKILATMIDDPVSVTSEQMDKWANSFETWDQCDQACLNLFDKTKYARCKIFEWYTSDKEFVKRTAYSLIAVLAVHDKSATDESFEEFYPIIIKGSDDNRNFVKKSVNWALRQIGKRNLNLNKSAIKTADEILELNTKSGNWIARNALNELKSDKIQERLKLKM